MRRIFHRFMRAESLLRARDHSLQRAAAALKERLDFATKYPQCTSPRSVRTLALGVLPFIPLATETIPAYPAVQDLLLKAVQVTNGFVIVLCTMMIVSILTFIVWGFSLFGRARKGSTGLLVQGIGLLTAVVIPVMTVSLTLAHASVHEVTLLDAVKDNLHFISLGIVSIGIHTLIWLEASEIKEALDTLWHRATHRRFKTKEQHARRRADDCEQAAHDVFSTEYLQLEAVRQEDPVTFDFQGSHPQILTWLASHQRQDDTLESPTP